MLGIIGAMDTEVAKLKELMTDVEIIEAASMQFYKGKLNGAEAVVVRAGVGKVNAACCTQTLIDRFPVDCVINTGIAGSLRAEIDIGDVVLATDAVEHDMDVAALGYAPGKIPDMDADDSAQMDYPTFEARAIEHSVRLIEEMAGRLA